MARVVMNITLLLLTIIINVLPVRGQTTPTNTAAKRAWNIAQMYIEEDSPELAVVELKKVISSENFAPAYIKLIELCYKLGDVKHVDIAEEYTRNFISLWPDRADEIKDVVALGEARVKLRSKKFYESLIGDWHDTVNKMGESYICFKVRKNENGGFYVIVPKTMWDYDWVTEWQDGVFMQWEGRNGVYIYEAGYGKTYDGYRVKIPTDTGSNYWENVCIYIPFDQPTVSEGKIKVTFSTKTSGPKGKWSRDPVEVEFVKD